MTDIATSIATAASTLKKGGVIAYPTEAVWGLGCDPNNNEAIQRLCDLKQRSISKGLLLVGYSAKQVTPLLEKLSEAQRQAVVSSWPGPYSWVLPNVMGFSDEITGGRDTVVVRISAHPVVRALSEKFKGLIVSTSANISGQPPAKTQLAVQQAFLSKLDYVLDGGSVGQQLSPSHIFDAKTGRQLR